jgi:hypothetical protein
MQESVTSGERAGLGISLVLTQLWHSAQAGEIPSAHRTADRDGLEEVYAMLDNMEEKHKGKE